MTVISKSKRKQTEKKYNMSASDYSDNNDLPNSVYSFQNQGTTICAKGPNVNSTMSMSGLGFRNLSTSRMQMPWNSSRAGYAESAYDPRNAYSRRELSPMSCRSASVLQTRNYDVYQPRGLSSQRSMYNGRSGSSMSVRTMDSNTSMCAVDIAMAFKTMSFNRCDLQLIKEAYNKYLKKDSRNRVQKRRNLRMLLKRTRRASGGESGEQGSNSSISSDDCQSVKSYRTVRSKKNTLSSCRSTRTDVTDFRNMQASNMYRDCSDNFRQNSFRNILSVGSRSVKEDMIYRSQNNPTKSQKARFHNDMTVPNTIENQSFVGQIQFQNDSVITKPNEKFKSSYRLPSERFDRSQSVSSLPIRGNNDSVLKPREQLKNIVQLPSQRFNRNQSVVSSPIKKINNSMTGRGRMGKGYQLPSQRFNQNQSIVSLPIPEENEHIRNLNGKSLQGPNKKQSVSSLLVPGKQIQARKENLSNQKSSEANSEQEEIFSEITTMEKSISIGNISQTKRSLDDDDITVSDKKRTKLSSPQKRNIKYKESLPKVTKTLTKNNDKSKEFVFAKPQFPLRKVSNIKNSHTQPTNKKSVHKPIQTQCPKPSQQPADLNIQATTEKIISKSQLPREKQISDSQQPTKKLTSKSQQSTDKLISKSQQSTDKLISKSQQSAEKLISKSQQSTGKLISKSPQLLDVVEPQDKVQNKNQHDQSEISDMSMRPSFIKRKLFSQKVDMAENKNSSSDNMEDNSPQNNIYSSIQKEKNRSRKLVASQSCLNRDVLGDESNLLDLIHKIVPPDRMNMTSATNRSEIHSNKSNGRKWDISTIIASGNNTGNVSDTYTDEEIFKPEESESKKDTPKKHNKAKPKTPDKCHTKTNINVKKNDILQNEFAKCKVVLNKIQPRNRKDLELGQPNSSDERNGPQQTLLKRVQTFWDTDVDSDLECRQTPYKKPDPKKSLAKVQRDPIKDQGRNKHDIENIPPEPGITKVASTKTKLTKATDPVENNNNKNCKTKTHKSKEKPAPQIKSKFNLSLKSKQNETADQSRMKSTKLNSSRIRTPKANKCCNESAYQSPNDSTGTLGRSLRSGTVYLSSPTTDKKLAPKNSKVGAKNKNVSKVMKNMNNSQSDLSFTLSTVKSKQTAATNNRVGCRTRQSDVSFSLTDKKSLDKTATSTKPNRAKRTKS